VSARFDSRAEVERMGALYGAPVETLRVPPQSSEAERAVLGGLMLAPKALPMVTELLDEPSFYQRRHGLIWRAIADMAERRKPFDAVTLGDWFADAGLLAEVDNGAYLIELANTIPSAANIRAYAEIVADKAMLRRLIDHGTELINAGYAPNGQDTADILAKAQQGAIGLMPKQRGGLVKIADTLSEWYQALNEKYNSGSRLTGLPTPWVEFNKATHGLQKGEVYIIAARPNMGKSVVGGQLAMFSGLRGVSTALFMLEGGRIQLNNRMVSCLSDVPFEWIQAPFRDGDNDDEELYWDRMAAAVKQLRDASLYVDDTASLNRHKFMARARARHMEQSIELLIVDHIHDFDINPDRARFEYGQIVQDGKTLAKEFNCPVVMLAQLNRNLASRADKRPIMADLRESGEIEQKADVIVFLHREDYYDANAMPGVVEAIIAKGRNIRSGRTVYLRNEFGTMAVRDWEGPLPAAPVIETKAKRTADRWGPQS